MWRSATIVLAVIVTAPAAAEPRLTTEGTEFVLHTADGRVLRSFDLVGATLTIKAEGRDTNVTIKAVEEDRRANGGRVLLHRFVVRGSSGQAVELCAPDADGRSLGFPVADGRGSYELTCTSGAIGKCVRWGYRPWEEQPGGPPLRALHQACVHMARADYGGDGRASTREGTLIHVCDRFGVRLCRDDAPLAFEAAWGIDGAVCVARVRVAENISLREIAARYPRVKPQLGPAACTQDSAMANTAALLFNRSRK
jgi:hypothetical protein